MIPVVDPVAFPARVSGPRARPRRGRAAVILASTLGLVACGGSSDSNSGHGGEVGDATGGHATGGQATGGHATGGQATGGQATGGQATGGQATGGQATGGQATGGQANGGAADAGPPDADAAPLGDNDVLVGAFQVLLTAAAEATDVSPAVVAQSSIVGRVQDGPTPALIAWTETLADGPCRLLVPRVPFCNVSCGGSAACVDDDVCQPYPQTRTVGTLRVRGIDTGTGESEFALEPVASNYQRSGLPFPPFLEGGPVRFDAAGGEGRPFSLEAFGIAPLVLTSAPLHLERGAGAMLTWAPATDATRSELLVRLDISHHGGSNGKIECEAPDTGALMLPASLLDALLELGSAGYPTVVVTRRAVGSALISAGRVDLWLLSSVEQSVQIPGLISCTADEDCPEAQTCMPDLKCQ